MRILPNDKFIALLDSRSFNNAIRSRIGSSNDQLSIINLELSNRNLTDIDFSKLQFVNATFTECTFEGANFRFIKLTDHCEFHRCLFKNIDAFSAIIKDTTFTECRLENIGFSKSDFQRVKLFDPELGNTITASTLDRFRNCNLVEMPSPLGEAIKLDFNLLTIDQSTRASWGKNSSIVKGINGLYNRKNNSSALIEEPPTGDSMLSGDGDMILTSLTKAKKAFNTALVFSLVIVAVKCLGITQVSHQGLSITASMIYFAMPPLILVWMYLCNTYLRDAIANYPYISTQPDAAKVGRFPWVITRYWKASSSSPQQGRLGRVESRIIRFLFSFHTLSILCLYAEFSDKEAFESIIGGLEVDERITALYISNHLFASLLYFAVLLLSVWQSWRLLRRSSEFQLPVLFRTNAPEPSPIIYDL